MGHLNASVRGKLRRREEKGENIGYTLVNTYTGYNYVFRTKMKDPTDKCHGKITRREEGEGTATPSVAFEVQRGIYGGLHFLGYKTAAQKKIDIDPMIDYIADPLNQKPLDVYNFILTLPSCPTVEHFLCPDNRVESSLTGFLISHMCGELRPHRNTEHFKWNTSAQWSHGTKPMEKLTTGRCQGIQMKRPERAKSNDTIYQVNWSFGDIDPMIEIWYKHTDITDEKEDIIIGRKVTLEVKAFPGGHQMDDIKWAIDGYQAGKPDGSVVAGYKATRYSARCKLLSSQDLQKKKLVFYWVKGAPKGKAFDVTCTAKIDGHEEKAKATFRVFTPSFKKRSCRRHITRHISIGAYPGSNFQNVYLGKMAHIASSNTIGPGSETGMELAHEIVMPPLDDESNLLQYYQILQEILLEYNGVKYWIQSNRGDGWRFDSDPKNPETIWVPLERVDWGWAAGVREHSQNHKNQSCDTRKFVFDFKKVWPKRLKPTPLPPLPEWRNETDSHELSKIQWNSAIKGIRSKLGLPRGRFSPQICWISNGRGANRRLASSS